MLVFGAACSDAVSSPDTPAQPVVQVTLVAGSSNQTASVFWSTPDEMGQSGPGTAVPADLVNLWLISADGNEVVFQPISGSPGKYAASRLVNPDETYELRGTVVESSVTSRVTVPGPLSLASPSTDTVRLSSGGALFAQTLPIEWAAGNASALAYALVDPATQAVVSQGVLQSSSGEVTLFPPQVPPTTATLTLSAYDVNATQFIFSDPPESSILGAFGLFGAAVTGPVITIEWE